jgi:hypothetical protein
MTQIATQTMQKALKKGYNQKQTAHILKGYFVEIPPVPGCSTSSAVLPGFALANSDLFQFPTGISENEQAGGNSINAQRAGYSGV